MPMVIVNNRKTWFDLPLCESISGQAGKKSPSCEILPLSFSCRLRYRPQFEIFQFEILVFVEYRE